MREDLLSFLVGGDWNHGMDYGILGLSHDIGNGKSSQLTIRHIFQRGRYTTNQTYFHFI
jgi:hypothetical protein